MEITPRLDKLQRRRFMLALVGNLMLMGGVAGAFTSGVFLAFDVTFPYATSPLPPWLCIVLIFVFFVTAAFGETLEAFGKDILSPAGTS